MSINKELYFSPLDDDFEKGNLRGNSPIALILTNIKTNKK